MVRTGLDICAEDGFEAFKGQAIGLVCNQASIASDYAHTLDRLLPHHQSGKLKLQAVFGPQHGLWGHTQDNMVEWEGARDPRTGLTVHSLYGERREPTDAMLKGVERLVFDVPDVGTRVYTFVWTLALCIKACERNGIPVTVLDRPNPIGGTQVEGPVLDPVYASFVGLHPLPMRHGMTVGEIGKYLQSRFYPKCELGVVEVQGWRREQYGDETGVPWAMPSPNMPSVETAVVYPGMVLLEGTNLSEGRGTTRPFETFGAPWIDAWSFTERLNALALPGAWFRPVVFQPTFQKHAGAVCGGAFLHVTDRLAFQPVLAGVAVLQEAFRQCPKETRWNAPPYEYEKVKPPIDVLAGNGWLRPAIESGEPLARVEERMREEASGFRAWGKGTVWRKGSINEH